MSENELSFEDFLKEQSNNKAEKLAETMNNAESTGFERDERIWQYKPDEKGNSTSVLRILPTGFKDAMYYHTNHPEIYKSMPFFARRYVHSFMENSWFDEMCPTSYGEDCPVCDYNKQALIDKTGKSGGDAFKSIEGTKVQGEIRNRRRKLEYYVNVLVIKDGTNPENNGKVFLFKYGKTIQDILINQMMGNVDADIKGINFTDFNTGCDFILQTFKEDGNIKYSRSQFKAPSKIEDNIKGLSEIKKEKEKVDKIKEYIEELSKSCYALHEFTTGDARIPFEELEEKLSKCVNITKPKSSNDNNEASKNDDNGKDGKMSQEEKDLLSQFN